MKLGKDLIKKDLKNVNMKKMLRRNQIIVTTLAVMIAAAGYLNYTDSQNLDPDSGAYEAGAMDVGEEEIQMENQAALDAQGGYEEIASLDQDGAAPEETQPLVLAEGEPAAQDGAGEAGTESGETAGAEAQAGLENPGEAILTSGMSVADYIAGVQLSREQVRARNKDTLLNIINSTGIEEAAKQEAIQEMIDLTELSEKENAAETLLMAKGFLDPVVSISSDKVDVIVNAASITDAQRAQIEDVVKRKTEMAADSIIITLLNLSE